MVLFRWNDAATPEVLGSITEALSAFVAGLDGVVAYRWSADAGLSPGNHQTAVIGDFVDADAFVAYRDHPEHQRIIRELIRPVLAERAAVQLALD